MICSLRLVDRHNGFFAAVAAFIIAAFTFTLWQSTEKLWRASEDQLEHTKSEAMSAAMKRLKEEVRLQEQISISQQSADAATRAANAAVNVELPILIMDFANLAATGNAAIGPKTPIPATFRPIFAFTNFGRSPAQVTAGCLEWIIAARGRDLPLPPIYKNIFPY